MLSFQSLIESVCFKGVALLGEIDADDDSNSAVLRSITTSLGQLKYRDTALLDKIADHLSTRLQAKGSLDSRDLVPFLLTSATLNYAPKNSEAVFTVNIMIVVSVFTVKIYRPLAANERIVDLGRSEQKQWQKCSSVVP